MFISIFIPTGNRIESLKKALDSLENQTYKNFEVIIVDYRSKSDAFKAIDSYKKILNIVIINQTEKGLSRAANLAIERAKGEIFIRTDDDVIMSKHWLEAINKVFEKDEKIGGVTGPTIVPEEYIKNRDLFSFEKKFKNGSFFWRTIGKFYFNFLMESNPYRVSHWFKSGAFSPGSNYVESLKELEQEVNNLEACNFAVRIDLLKKIGGFDSVYAGVGEYHEADASFKIKNLGYKLIFNPKIILYHCPSQDGFFNDRPSSYPRMINFIVFYLRHIKPDSFSKIIRFISYILFQDLYYFYQFITTRQFSQLGAIPGSIMGFVKYYKLKIK